MQDERCENRDMRRCGLREIDDMVDGDNAYDLLGIWSVSHGKCGDIIFVHNGECLR